MVDYAHQRQDVVGGPGAPLGKQVVVGMDTNIKMHAAWNDWPAWSAEMAPYWTQDVIYDFNFVGEWDFGATKTLWGWYLGEHMHFNTAFPDCQWTDIIRAATNDTCTSASYGNVRWVEEFAGVPPPPSKPWVRIRDLDFYLLEGDRIKINWCIIDAVDIFEQAGYHVLPPAPMSSEGYKAPSAMDGNPAPLSALYCPEDRARSESVWRKALEEDYVLNTGGSRLMAERVTWYGPGGVGTAKTREQYVEHWLKPLHAAFTGIRMETDLLVCEGPYCGAHFYLWGNHTGEWLGEPASGKVVPIRCGAHARIDDDGRIIEGWLIIDHARAFDGMGVDLFARVKAKAEALARA